MSRPWIAVVPLAVKQLVRHRIRTGLTVIGIGTGMFLFAVVENMQQSVGAAVELGAGDATLVVFRENRFCPSTSRLPEYYSDEIADIDGVEEVVPVQITVNNCQASLDVVTFRGVPPEKLRSYAPDMQLVSGGFAEWQATDDGALLGEHLAKRRGLAVGDSFEAAGVRVRVSGVLRSDNPQDNAVAYVHLPFLQQASRKKLGEVTQFNVRVSDVDQLEQVSKAIDARFASAEDPTHTQPEKAFFAHAAQDLLELIGFTRWVAVGAIAAVLGLIANAVLLVVRSRVKENAILQTLGFPDTTIAWLVMLEGVLLGLAGGLLGVGGATVFLNVSLITFGNEGQLLTIVPQLSVFVQGLGLALALGGVAALVPAWTAIRQPIVRSLHG